MKRKKAVSGVVAVACAAAVALTGTFAWQSISNAVNNFSGTKTTTPKTPGANLHDDFSSATGDKKIYVENTGDTKVYVRVRLGEYMETGSSTPTKPVAYTDHIPVSTGRTADMNNIEDCQLGGFHDAGTKSDGTQYFGWTMGIGSHSYNSIKGTSAWTSAASQEVKDQLVADALGSAQAGTGNSYDSNSGKSSTVVKTDDSSSSIKKATITSNGVITMAQFTAKSEADKKAFVGWVYDNDGYAYWSQALDSGQATGDLLSKVNLPDANSLDYFYSIKATMEYVDQTDIGAWTNDGADGHRAYTLNGNGQCSNFPGTNEKGDTIKAGSQAGNTTIQASDSAAALLKGISSNPATAVTLTPTTMTLTVGGTGKAAATVTTADGSNTTDPVTWKSADTSVATVDGTGKITAVKEGNTTITAAAGAKSASCTVNVKKNTVAVTGVTVSPSAATVAEGGTSQLAAEVKPEDATDKNLSWRSEDPSIVTVSDGGLLTGIKPGTTNIIVTDSAGKEYKTPVTVTAKAVAAAGFTFNKDTLSVGNTQGAQKITATLAPANTTDTISVTSPIKWTFGDGAVVDVVSIASIDNGKSVTVTPLKVGTTSIVASYINGEGTTVTKSIPITITSDYISSTGVSLDKSNISIDLNQIANLTGTIATGTATNKNITWTIADPLIARLSETTTKSGTAITVYPLAVGTTTITATDADGNTAACTLTSPSQELTLLRTDNTEMQPGEADNDYNWYSRFEMWEAYNENEQVGYYWANVTSEPQYKLNPKGNQTMTSDGDHTEFMPRVQLSYYVGEDTSDYTWQIVENDQYNATQMIDNVLWGTHLWTFNEMYYHYDDCFTIAKVKITQTSTGRSKIIDFKYSAYALIATIEGK